jgi:F0F1-type ATP synthase delta subunit
MFIVPLIIFQIFIFVILVFALRKIMMKNVVSATRHINEMGQDYDKKEEEISRRFEELKQESEETVRKAQQEAQELKAGIIKEAESERDKMLKQSRSQSDEIIKQADKSRQLLLSEIDERIAKEAVNKACELIQETLPEQLKQNVHRYWVKELINAGFSELERLRIPKDIDEVKIISAFNLDEEERKNLFDKLKNTLGSGVKFKEEIEPKVVAGIIITIGSLVLDGSLRNKIKENIRNA